MHGFQIWLFRTFLAMKWVKPFMTSKWGWPFCETVHFLGLSLLMGTIGMFDLRLLGMGKRVPWLSALQVKLVPWGARAFHVLAFLYFTGHHVFSKAAAHRARSISFQHCVPFENPVHDDG